MDRQVGRQVGWWDERQQVILSSRGEDSVQNYLPSTQSVMPLSPFLNVLSKFNHICHRGMGGWMDIDGYRYMDTDSYTHIYIQTYRENIGGPYRRKKFPITRPLVYGLEELASFSNFMEAQIFSSGYTELIRSPSQIHFSSFFSSNF